MIEAFLKYITSELQLSDCTVEAYRSDLQQWISFATADGRHDLRPETTSTSDLRLWIASVARNGASPRTIRRKIQSLRAFFRFLMRYHGLSFNPAMDIQPPKIAKELPVYVRPEEMNALLDAENDPSDFESTRNRLIIDMFYSTGLRCSELMNLLDTNVDEKKGELKVHGKRNKDRIVPFGPELTDMITRYRNLRQQQTGCASSLTFFVRPDSRSTANSSTTSCIRRWRGRYIHQERAPTCSVTRSPPTCSTAAHRSRQSSSCLAISH